MDTPANQVPLQARVTRAMLWNTVFLPLRTLVSFGANIILVRALSQQDFGIFVQVTALLATIGLYVDLGIERSLIRFVPEVEKSFGRRGLWQFFAGLMGIKLIVMLPVIAFLYLRPDWLAGYFQWGALDLPLVELMTVLLILGAFSDVLYQFLLAFFRLGGRNLLDVITTIVQSVLVVVLVSRGGGVLGAFMALTAATILNVILGGWVVAHAFAQVHTTPGLAVSWRSIYTRLAKFSALSYVMNLSTFFYDLPFVILILSYFNDLAGVALFGLAFGRIVMPALRVIFTPLNGIQMPMFARIHAENNHAKLEEAYLTLSRFLCLWLIPFAFALAVLARPLIILFFQARYADAAATAAVLAIFLFGESLFSPAQIVLMVSDRYRAVLLARILALISIPLMFAAIPPFGAFGAAVAIGGGRLLTQLVSTWIAAYRYQLRFPTGFFVRITLISMGMAAAMEIPLALIGSASPFESILKLIVATLGGGGVFVILFKLFGRMEDSDKQRLLTLPIPFKHALVNWLS